jgi:hypothetical protein
MTVPIGHICETGIALASWEPDLSNQKHHYFLGKKSLIFTIKCIEKYAYLVLVLSTSADDEYDNFVHLSLVAPGKLQVIRCFDEDLIVYA